MSKNALSILVVLFIVAILAAFIIPGFIRQRIVPVEDNKIKMLERQNDSLEAENAKLRILESAYSNKIDSLSVIASERKTKIVYLNNRKNERIKIIDTMSGSELDSFLTNVKTN